MIRLKSLIEQPSNSNNMNNMGNLQSLPKVLFIGDGYTKSNYSYAKRLIKSKIISGRIVAWPRINIQQLVKLANRYVNDSYAIISIMFGDIVKQKMEISEFAKYINELSRITKMYGAKLVIIQNPEDAYSQYDKYLNVIDDMKVDLTISTDGTFNDSTVQLDIANDWISGVNSKLNIHIQNIDIDSEPESIKLDTDDDEYKLKDTKSSSGYEADVMSVTANYSDSLKDQTFSLIRRFEGFTSIAKLDTDGYCRIGHGSMHITKKDGTVIDLGKPDSGKSCVQTYQYQITEKDAIRDLQRLIANVFLPGVTRIIENWGGDVSQLNNATIAALTSVMYNYGHIPKQLKPAIQSNDMRQIGELIKTFSSNRMRREIEGNYILNSLDPVTDVQPENDKKSLKLTKLISKFLPVYSPFGQRKRGMHYGIDYSPMPAGSKIYTSMPGTVSKAGNIDPSGWGNTIMIDHIDGNTTLYAHLSSVDVNVGDEVESGTFIGKTGGVAGAPGSGNSEGEHLHWEYHPGGYLGKSSAADGERVANKYFKIV